MSDPWIERFRKEAVPKIRKEFKPEKIILFGSRVRGNAREDSDIDVVIISASFSGTPFLKRMPLMLKKVSFPKHIDYICYTPQEFKKIRNESVIIKDAMENSMEITAA